LFEFISIELYHAQLGSGTVTCVQAVQHYIQAINKNNSLNAFLEVYTEEALQRAATLDAVPIAEPKGKLFGVVIGIKDLLCYKDHKVTASSKILSGYISVYSATAIERLLAEAPLLLDGKIATSLVWALPMKTLLMDQFKIR
jgi:aspartyl-tRNA(Asn)/glutamyl-tRNA(Gln) amidotransferase subunit A